MGLMERVKRKARTLTPRPVILMYHRVATPAVDPWDLAVSPHRFEEQVAALVAHRTVLPLAELARQAGAGELPADALAITFDDGYVDNLEVALPVLQRHAAPATVFVSTGYVGSDREYWWDELARMLLGGGGDLGSYHSAWARLKAMDDAEREEAMAELRRTHLPAAPDPTDLPMTADELAVLAAEPLITIGAHSVTHASLKQLPPSLRESEIAGSRSACEAFTGRPVELFAYPFGDVDRATRDAVAAAGFSSACSTEPRSIRRSGEDPLTLPRMAAPNVGAETLLARIRALA